MRRVCLCRRHRRLLVYNGKSAERPLLLAIKGRVLDVREGADYYGPEGPYKVMAGCDASKAFAMMSLKAEDAIPDVSDVPPEHLKILDDWCAPRVSSARACAIDIGCTQRLRVPAGDRADARGQTRVRRARAAARYDKLTQKYPTVGCLEGNTFGYGLGDIDIAASEAIAELAKEERLKAKDE